VKLLRDRRVAALLAAEVISSLGNQMTWLALPWFVLRTTHSPERMTWVIVAEILPIAVLGFWGGAIAARIGTRRTMLACDLVRAPLLASIPVLHEVGLLSFPLLLAPSPASSSPRTSACSARSSRSSWASSRATSPRRPRSSRRRTG
jgi:MFS family permease